MPATPQFATLRALQGLALPNHTICTADGREKVGASTKWRLEAQRLCFFSGHLPGEVTLDARVHVGTTPLSECDMPCVFYRR